MTWLSRRLLGAWRWGVRSSANGSSAFSTSVLRGCLTSLAGVVSPLFPPEVAVHLVKMACERPDKLGRSLSQWDCLELARQLEREGIVEGISAETVRRILEYHWDIHLLPKVGWAWMPTGTQLAVMTPGQNQKHDLAGAFDLATRTLLDCLGPPKNQCPILRPTERPQ
jgi:hypothetical protein